MITALAGGVGAAKFLQGLAKVIPEEQLTIIGNTGDDIELYGLHISPDLDIVMYTLAGVVDEDKGWGIRGDTFNCQKMLEKLGYETWFKLGDKDLATHIYRSQLLKKELPLSVITKNLCGKFGVVPKIFPMTDNKVETKIKTPKGTMHFEEYHVKRQDRPRVLEVLFEGIEEANPAPRVVESIIKAEAVIICPSNPIVSIGTILSVNGIRAALKETKAKIAAVSPIIGGSPVKGPADKLMEGLGLEVTAFAVAESYKDFIDAFIIDEKDKEEKEKIERLKMDVTVTHSIMKSIEDKTRLARTTLGSIGIL